MIERPHSVLLNREQPAAQVAEHFSKQVALLKDVADYGSNLIIRSFESSSKQMSDAIVCCTLLPKVVMMVDAVHVLFTAGCVHAALLPARSGFEASLYIDYILVADSEKRAMRYLVANYRRERLWAERVIPGTKEEVAYRKIPESLGLDFLELLPGLKEQAVAHLSEVNRILAQPALAEIDDEFSAKRKKNASYDREWYALDEKTTTIRSVARAVGRLADYEVFYAKGSQVTHSSAYKDQMLFLDGTVRLKPIRNLQDTATLTQTIFTSAFRTYSMILMRVRPSEMLAFRKKYTEDWRDAFQNIPNIDFSFSPNGKS